GEVFGVLRAVSRVAAGAGEGARAGQFCETGFPFVAAGDVVVDAVAVAINALHAGADVNVPVDFVPRGSAGTDRAGRVAVVAPVGGGRADDVEEDAVIEVEFAPVVRHRQA